MISRPQFHYQLIWQPSGCELLQIPLSVWGGTSRRFWRGVPWSLSQRNSGYVQRCVSHSIHEYIRAKAILGIFTIQFVNAYQHQILV
jgi:hypothetical protein